MSKHREDLSITKKLIDKANTHFENHGYSLHATVRKDTHKYIGFIRLLITAFESHFTPSTKTGSRLSSNHWRQSFVTEGARKPF